MFLEKAKLTINENSVQVPAEEICWDYDDAYNYIDDTTLTPHDFDWYVTDFVLENIGTADFEDVLVDFINRSVDFKNLPDQDPESWEGIWRALKKGEEIHTPVHIALAYEPGYDNRIYISDGWHRTALYLKAGKKTIPAIVGVPKYKQI